MRSKLRSGQVYCIDNTKQNKINLSSDSDGTDMNAVTLKCGNMQEMSWVTYNDK